MVQRRFNHTNFRINKYTGQDARGVVKEQNFRDRYVDRENSLMESSGSPYLWFYRVLENICYCRDNVNLVGHENCPSCFGTGFLKSYEKQGYRTFTFAKTWPGMNLTATKFLKGWGYKEVMKGQFITPQIDLMSAKDISFITVDQFSETDSIPIVEHTYDDVNWFSNQDDIDLTQDWIKFRVTTNGSRFLRVRLREKSFSIVTVDVPQDIYLMASVTDKQKDTMELTNEKLDISDESEAWTLEHIESGDFIVDIVGSLNHLRPNGIYLTNGVRVGIHQPTQIEHRRDMTLRYILPNSWMRQLYRIPF